MANTLTWLTDGTTYPRPDTGRPDIEVALWVSCENGGSGGSGLVQFVPSGPGATKGIKTIPDNGFAAIEFSKGAYVAHVKLSIPVGVADADTFVLTATPYTSDQTADGPAITLTGCSTKVFDTAATGQTVQAAQTYAITPGDPLTPGSYYTIFLNVKDKAGAAVEGAAAQISLDPPGTSQLYLADGSGTALPSAIPGVYYVKSDQNGKTSARLATNAGVNIQVVNVIGNVLGMAPNPAANFFFSTTPDTGDMAPGWFPPTLPDASSGNLNLQPGQKTYRLTVPINDQDAIPTPKYRGVIIDDTSAFLVTFPATQTLDNESITKLTPGTNNNRFTVFSQDDSGNIQCSGASVYGMTGAGGVNLPNPDLVPRTATEPVVDPFPPDGVITKNHVNAHDGLGLTLTNITISLLGKSDKNKDYDPTLPIAATSVVFTFYMNGYESPTSTDVRSQAYNHVDELNTPVPTLKYNAANPPDTLEWSTPLVSLIYASSTGWFQNSNARPPRQLCGFEYYIQQMQGMTPHKWYSKLDKQRLLPAGEYQANIPQ